MVKTRRYSFRNKLDSFCTLPEAADLTSFDKSEDKRDTSVEAAAAAHVEVPSAMLPVTSHPSMSRVQEAVKDTSSPSDEKPPLMEQKTLGEEITVMWA